MEQWGLGDKRKASYHALSGGQRQRLFIALALVNAPEVVFLDEMTTGLDPAARRVAWDLVRQVRDMGTTVVLVTHFMEEAERLCDRIAVMDAGRIVAEGAPQKLVTDYAEYVTVVFSTDAPDVGFLAGVPHVDRVMRHGAARRGARRRRRAGPRRLLARGARHHAAGPARRACRRSRTSSSRSPATRWRSERVKVLLKLTWIEIKLLAREPVTLLFSFAFPVLVLVLLGGIFGSEHMKQGAYQGVKMMDWYVPAFIGLVIASIGTISLPVHLSSYRERGVLRRFRASGVSEAALLGSQLLVSLGRRARRARSTIAVLGMAAYGADPASSPAGVALAYVVGVFCFSGIGVLLASLAPTARAAQSVGLLLWFVMLFVSGTSAPLDLLPELDGGHRQGAAAVPPGDRARGPVDRARRSTGCSWASWPSSDLVTTLLSLRLFRWE